MSGNNIIHRPMLKGEALRNLPPLDRFTFERMERDAKARRIAEELFPYEQAVFFGEMDKIFGTDDLTPYLEKNKLTRKGLEEYKEERELILKGLRHALKDEKT
jgi:hypothetical protein